MIPLHEIDVERIQLLRSGKDRRYTNNVRGCGKTTEKMVTLLSYVRPQNVGNKYLFIAENYTHNRDIYRVFFGWLQTLVGVFPKSASSMLSHYVAFEPTGKTIPINNRYMKPKRPPSIGFDFISASMLYEPRMRGMCYNKIIIDLTPETYHVNEANIEFALSTERL